MTGLATFARSLAGLCLAGLVLTSCSPGDGRAHLPGPGAGASVAPEPAPDYTKIPWRLSSVGHAGTVVPVPPTWHATVTFGRDDGDAVFSDAVFDDTVNTISGRIRFTDAGYVVSDQASTLAAYVGSDPRVRLVIAAMAAASGTLAGSSPVAAQVVAGHLVLQAQGYRLTFDRG